jgi:hypothetical protein
LAGNHIRALLEGLMALGKKLLLLAAVCGLAWSQTGLTTIQDTLFKADGTRFNGTLTIHWSTFDAVNGGTIVQQSANVPVVNGNLQVRLTPNATAQPPANVYNVQYQSDGREQFAETWTVPVSTASLKVSVVRTGTLAASGGGTGGTTASQTPILESTVVGLLADLAQRPLKGVGFGTNRVAIVNDGGQIETAVGDVGACVFVDGTTGPCGQTAFADAETPGGIVDGTNNTLTLAGMPLGSSLMLFRNGLYMTPNFDYTLTGSSLRFPAGALPRAGDTLTASYRVDTSVAGNLASLTAGGGTVQTVAAQVICGAAGASTSAAAWASLGGCDIPAAGLHSGDRIEVRFTFAHSGTASGFSLQLNWGATTMLARSAGAQDAAVAGRGEAAITAGGAQLNVESWGTVLPFQPGILNAPAQPGLKVDFRASLSAAGADTVTLTNYTVLRYPGN